MSKFTYYVEFDFIIKDGYTSHFKNGYIPKDTKNKYSFIMDKVYYEFIKDIYDNKLEDVELFNFKLYTDEDNPKYSEMVKDRYVVSEDMISLSKSIVTALICEGIVLYYNNYLNNYFYKVTIPENDTTNFIISNNVLGEEVVVISEFLDLGIEECIEKTNQVIHNFVYTTV